MFAKYDCKRVSMKLICKVDYAWRGLVLGSQIALIACAVAA